MTSFREFLNRLLGGSNSGPTVSLYCPLSDGMDEEDLIATEEREPDEWIEDDRIAVYECPVCGSCHRFLWGPPAPLYLGDCPDVDPAEAS